MEVRFTKLSDVQHSVTVLRDDGTTDTVTLDSRSFLAHDLAHLAVESELGLASGVWGSVATGGSLSGDGLDGPDVTLAETLAGRLQTLMRTDAGIGAYVEVLGPACPALAERSAAAQLHERVRRLRGHWAATPYGGDMVLDWPNPVD